MEPGLDGGFGSTSVDTPQKGHQPRKRLRAARACDTCHRRKTRCDIVTRGIPCTNCIDYSTECHPHVPRTRVRSKRKPVHPASIDTSSSEANTNSPRSTEIVEIPHSHAESLLQVDLVRDSARSLLPQAVRNSLPASEYLGESLGLFLLQDEQRPRKMLYHPLSGGSIPVGACLGSYQIHSLHCHGAFILPPRELCDELIEDFFLWVAPVVPVVNKTSFMRQYVDPENPPSLLLLQAMLLAASKVSRRPLFLAHCGNGGATSDAFYRRAKALYDAEYELNRITALQALMLMGWYCENPQDVSNISYWTRIAIAVAQSIGMHRRVDGLSSSESRLYRRIWWSLFSRDRLVSVGLGRPLAINSADCDIDMISESDFIEGDEEHPSDMLHARFFVHYVRLCDILGQVVSTYYAPASRAGHVDSSNHLCYDTLLAHWLRDRPTGLIWQKNSHTFWASVLHLHYCTAICLLHRAHMSSMHPEKSQTEGKPTLASAVQLSREAAYDAASCIVDIVETLRSSLELHYAPPFILYSLYSALLVQVHRINTARNPVVLPLNSRVEICLSALREISGSWTTANAICLLFCQLLGGRIGPLDRDADSVQSGNLSTQIHPSAFIQPGHGGDTGAGIQHFLGNFDPMGGNPGSSLGDPFVY